MRKRRRQEECGWERGKREGVKVENVGGSWGGGGGGRRMRPVKRIGK